MLLAAALGAAFMARSAIDDGLCSHFLLIGPQVLDSVKIKYAVDDAVSKLASNNHLAQCAEAA
jgi:hypothetical protein